MNTPSRARRWSITAVLAGLVSAVACHRAPPTTSPDDAGAPGLEGVCGADGWCWEIPRPLGVRVNRLWASGPGDLWAVGDQGLILHHDGRRWTRVPFDNRHEFVAVAGRARGDAWAIGENSLLRLQGDGWSEVTLPRGALPMEASLRDLLVLPSGEAWVVGSLRQKSHWGDMEPQACIVGHLENQVWKFDTDYTDCGPLDRVWAGRGADDVWAQGANAVLHWNGRYLTKNPRQKPPARNRLHGDAGGWRLTRHLGSGHLKRAAGAGSPPELDAEDFWAFGAGDVWAVDSGRLKHFDGRAWVEGGFTYSPVPHAVAARSPKDIWVLAGDPSHGGAQPSLLHFNGTRWVTRLLPTDPRRGNTANHPCGSQKMMAVAALPKGDVWALTSCALWRFDGRRFTEVIPATPTHLLSLLGRSNDDVWVGGEKVLMHWDGRALTTHPTAFAVDCLWGHGTELWAALPVQRWNGSTFVVPPELNAEDMKNAQFHRGISSGEDMWLVGAGHLGRWRAGRVELIQVPGAARLLSMWAAPAGGLWVVGADIVMHADDIKSPKFRAEDTAGLGGIFELGGTAGLVWAVSDAGLLFKHPR